jgi:predicted permease
MRNLKLAFRTLFNTPFVTVVAILSLALGIGANAAIYSVFNQMLLRPLPVPQPERLVNFAAPGPIRGSNSCNQAGDCSEVFSYPMFRDLQKAKTAFSGIAGHFLFGVSVARPGQAPVSGQGTYVSGSYFPVLGIRPALGRLLTPNDDKAIGGEYVAVLSYEFWASQLGADRSVVGRQMTINGNQLTVVGVAAKGFTGTTLGARPYAFVPITMRSVLSTGWNQYERRNGYWVYIFGRLKAGATIEQGLASMNAVYRPLINDVEAPQQKDMSAQTLARFKAKVVTMTDGRKGQSSAIRQSRAPLTLLFSITGIVLLIACANIANLLLAKAAQRTMEMAVRLSLGATRQRLVVQVLAESLLLAALGGTVSILVAHWTLNGIMALLPTQIQATSQFGLSLPVLGFTAAVSLVTGLVFGLMPALQCTRPDLVTELRNNSGKLSGGRAAAKFRTSLVTAQVALSMALLISAGLFIKSLRNISRVNLGIRIDNVATFGIAPARTGYDSTRAWALYRRVEDALAAIPGVTGVTSSSIQLLASNNWGEGVSVEGFKKEPNTDTDFGSRSNAVGANYFTVLGVPLAAGRDFKISDYSSAERVAIVNETFAKKFHLWPNAVGKHMSVGNDSLNITIIGLAKDAKYSEVKDTVPPVFMRPWRQAGTWSSNNFYVRSSVPAEQILRTIPAVMKTLDPNLPVDRLKLLPQQVEDNVYMDRMISTLSASFAALATLLAAVGLYGVLAYSVAQRTREIGIRMALGAQSTEVMRMVLMQGMRVITIGLAAGIVVALIFSRVMRSLLFETPVNDPITFAGVALMFLAVGFAASYVPARRVTKVDPLIALRSE